MNISGRTLKPLLARYPLGPSTAHFILYDHLDFPDDKVQIRKGGSASGQNGMRSCLDVLGRKNAGEVFQVRIGIDRPTNSVSRSVHGSASTLGKTRAVSVLGASELTPNRL
jgi:PTH1 family peptidyl-tRNA hydrolase